MTLERPAGRVTASVFTSPHATPDLDPEPELLALIAAARERIRFAVYSFTLPDVAQALIAAHRRGVDVRGVGDATSWSGKTAQWGALVAAGVDVRKWGALFRLMHDKVLVADGTQVALGSYNWTTQAETANVEVMVVVTGSAGGHVLGPVLEEQIERSYAAGTAP